MAIQNINELYDRLSQDEIFSGSGLNSAEELKGYLEKLPDENKQSFYNAFLQDEDIDFDQFNNLLKKKEQGRTGILSSALGSIDLSSPSVSEPQPIAPPAVNVPEVQAPEVTPIAPAPEVSAQVPQTIGSQTTEPTAEVPETEEMGIEDYSVSAKGGPLAGPGKPAPFNWQTYLQDFSQQNPNFITTEDWSTGNIYKKVFEKAGFELSSKYGFKNAEELKRAATGGPSVSSFVSVETKPVKLKPAEKPKEYGDVAGGAYDKEEIKPKTKQKYFGEVSEVKPVYTDNPIVQFNIDPVAIAEGREFVERRTAKAKEDYERDVARFKSQPESIYSMLSDVTYKDENGNAQPLDEMTIAAALFNNEQLPLFIKRLEKTRLPGFKAVIGRDNGTLNERNFKDHLIYLGFTDETADQEIANLKQMYLQNLANRKMDNLKNDFLRLSGNNPAMANKRFLDYYNDKAIDLLSEDEKEGYNLAKHIDQLYDLLDKELKKPGTLSAQSDKIESVKRNIQILQEQLNSIRENPNNLYDWRTGQFVNKNITDKRKFSQIQQENKEFQIKYGNQPKDELVKKRDQLIQQREEVFNLMKQDGLDIPEKGTFASAVKAMQISASRTAGTGQIRLADGRYVNAATYEKKMDEYNKQLFNIERELYGVNRAVMLNEDVALRNKVDRGFLESTGKFLSEAGKSIGRTITPGAQNEDAKADWELRNSYFPTLEQSGFVIAPNLKSAARKDVSELISDSAGTLVEAVFTIATGNALLPAVKSLKWADRFKNILKNKYGKIGESIFDTSADMVRSGIIFETAGQGFATGVGEQAGQRAFDYLELDKFFKGKAKVLEYLARVITGGSAETVQEYAGQYLQTLADQGVDIQKNFKTAFGRDSETALDQFLQIAITSVLFSGASNYKILRASRTRLNEILTNPGVASQYGVVLDENTKKEVEDVLRVVDDKLNDKTTMRTAEGKTKEISEDYVPASTITVEPGEEMEAPGGVTPPPAEGAEAAAFEVGEGPLEAAQPVGAQPVNAQEVNNQLAKEGINDVSLQKVEEYGKEIESGNVDFERFSPSEQRGLIEGGPVHVAATIITGKSDRAADTQDDSNDRQEEIIKEYAQKMGIWTENAPAKLKEKYGDPFQSGKESLVWLDEQRGVVVKSSVTDQYPTLREALDGITLSNAYFPAAKITVVGFGTNEKGEFEIITEQPYIQGVNPTEQEIKEHFNKLGFTENERMYQGKDAFGNEEVIFKDAAPKNVIKTPEGNIVPIDLIAKINKPELNANGTRTLPSTVAEEVTEAAPEAVEAQPEVAKEVKEFEPSKRYEKIDEDGFPVVAYTDSETGQTEFETSEIPQTSASKTIGGSIAGLFSMLRNTGQPKNKKISIYQIEEKPSVEIQPSNVADFAFLEEVRYNNKVNGKKILEINLNDNQVEFLNDFYDSFSADEDQYVSLLEKYNVEDRQDLEDLFREKIKNLIPSDVKGFFRAEVSQETEAVGAQKAEETTEGSLTKEIKKAIATDKEITETEKKVFNDLFSTENISLKKYQDIFFRYKVNDFSIINSFLRKGLPITKENLQKEGVAPVTAEVIEEDYNNIVKVLSNTIFSPKEKITLYRSTDYIPVEGAEQQNLSNYEIGDKISDAAFVSTTIDENKFKDIKKPLIKFELNPGDKINGTYLAGNEKEFLIDKNTEFVVKNKEIIDGNVVLTVGLPFKKETVGTQTVIDNKSSIKELFNSNPKLAEVGTEEQYSKYINSIFPDSKVKDIVFHGSKTKKPTDIFVETFIGKNHKILGVGKGFYFTKDFNYSKVFGETTFSIINITNPTDFNSNNYDTKEELEAATRELSSKGDGVIDSRENFYYPKGEEKLKLSSSPDYIVFKPEQIHILGSEQDIEAFKEFVSKEEGIGAQPKDVFEYGAQNKIITKQKYEEAIRNLRNPNLPSGFDFSKIGDLVKAAMYHIEAGSRKFADFTKKMVEQFGRGVKQYLPNVFRRANNQMRQQQAAAPTTAPAPAPVVKTSAQIKQEINQAYNDYTTQNPNATPEQIGAHLEAKGYSIGQIKRFIPQIEDYIKKESVRKFEDFVKNFQDKISKRRAEIEKFMESNPGLDYTQVYQQLKDQYSDFELFKMFYEDGADPELLDELFGTEYRQTIQRAIDSKNYNPDFIREIDSDIRSRKTLKNLGEANSIFTELQDFATAEQLVEAAADVFEMSGVEEAMKTLTDKMRAENQRNLNSFKKALKGEDITEEDALSVTSLLSFSGRILRMGRGLFMTEKGLTDLIIKNLETATLRQSELFTKKKKLFKVTEEQRKKIEAGVKKYLETKGEFEKATKDLEEGANALTDSKFEAFDKAKAEHEKSARELKDFINKLYGSRKPLFSRFITSMTSMALLSFRTIFIGIPSNIEQMLANMPRRGVGKVLGWTRILADKAVGSQIALKIMGGKNLPLAAEALKRGTGVSVDPSLYRKMAAQRGWDQTKAIVLKGVSQSTISEKNFLEGGAEVDGVRDFKMSYRMIAKLIESYLPNKKSFTDEEWADAFDKVLVAMEQKDANGKPVLALQHSQGYDTIATFFRGLFGVLPTITGRAIALSGDRYFQQLGMYEFLASYANSMGITDPVEVQRFIRLNSIGSGELRKAAEKAGNRRIFATDNKVVNWFGRMMGGFEKKEEEIYNRKLKQYSKGKKTAAMVQNLNAVPSVAKRIALNINAPFVRIPTNALAKYFRITSTPTTLIMAVRAQMKLAQDMRNYQENYSLDKNAKMSESKKKKMEADRVKLFEQQRLAAQYWTEFFQGLQLTAFAFLLLKSGAVGAPYGDDDEAKKRARAAGIAQQDPAKINISQLIRYIKGETRGQTIQKGDITFDYRNLGMMGFALSAICSGESFYRVQKAKQEKMLGAEEDLAGMIGFQMVAESLSNGATQLSFIQNIATLATAAKGDFGKAFKDYMTGITTTALTVPTLSYGIFSPVERTKGISADPFRNFNPDLEANEVFNGEITARVWTKLTSRSPLFGFGIRVSDEPDSDFVAPLEVLGLTPSEFYRPQIGPHKEELYKKSTFWDTRSGSATDKFLAFLQASVDPFSFSDYEGFVSNVKPFDKNKEYRKGDYFEYDNSVYVALTNKKAGVEFSRGKIDKDFQYIDKKTDFVNPERFKNNKIGSEKTATLFDMVDMYERATGDRKNYDIFSRIYSDPVTFKDNKGTYALYVSSEDQRKLQKMRGQVLVDAWKTSEANSLMEGWKKMADNPNISDEEYNEAVKNEFLDWMLGPLDTEGNRSGGVKSSINEALNALESDPGFDEVKKNAVLNTVKSGRLTVENFKRLLDNTEAYGYLNSLRDPDKKKKTVIKLRDGEYVFE